MKGILAISAVAVTLAFGMATGADAKTSVHVYFGVPHYSYQVGPGYIYRDGYGWYNGGDRYNRNRISCGHARGIVRNKGFRNVSAIECDGRTYTFRAIRRGNPVTVYVNSRTGAVWRG